MLTLHLVETIRNEKSALHHQQHNAVYDNMLYVTSATSPDLTARSNCRHGERAVELGFVALGYDVYPGYAIVGCLRVCRLLPALSVCVSDCCAAAAVFSG